jgi:hypothetical protein
VVGIGAGWVVSLRAIRGEWVRVAPLWGLVGAPVGVAVFEAFRSPRLNYLDYWVVLAATNNANGSLSFADLFHLYNEHPIALVGAVFRLDAAWFAGDNRSLGVFSVLLALGMLAGLWAMLPKRLDGTKRVAVLAGLSALVFSSAALEYFGNGMMGTQWLLGLAPAVGALAFAHRGHTVPAVVFALIGSLGHGSAFGVWIALAVVAWLRRDRWWRIALPLVLGAAVFTWWQLAPWPPQYPQSGTPGAESYLGAMLTTLGQAWSLQSVDVALLAGALTTGALGAMVVAAVRSRLGATTAEVDEPAGELAGWYGLGMHMVIAAAMIGISRGGIAFDDGLAPRYAAVALLAVAALLVLTVVRGPRPLRAHTVAVALSVALATYAVGASAASSIRAAYVTQPTLAVAMHVDATQVMQKLYGYPPGVPLARRMGVYPFTGDFSLGCGGGQELGTTLDTARAIDLPAPKPDRNTAGMVETGPVTGDTLIQGWAMIGGEQADCVLVTDPHGRVIGGGSVGLPRQDVLQVVAGTGRTGWQAVAPPGTTAGQVYVVRDGVLFRIVTVARTH